MFGTLVICLPSKHEGGEVQVTHGGKEKIFRTADSSEFGFTYLCWFVTLPLSCRLLTTKIHRYGDVKHKIAPVTSGCRVVLTYNLINPRNPAKTPVEFDTNKNELESALTFWKDNFRKHTSSCPKVLVYILEHLYTKPSLSYSALKGGDSVRGQCLAELCKKLGFEFFLASLERGVEGIVTTRTTTKERGRICIGAAFATRSREIHTITDIENEWLYLNHIVDLEGTMLFDEIPLSESQIVQEDPFPDGPNEEEDFTGPTGNQGVSATHYYRRSVSPNSDQKPVLKF